jgi:hypothetical protein
MKEGRRHAKDEDMCGQGLGELGGERMAPRIVREAIAQGEEVTRPGWRRERGFGDLGLGLEEPECDGDDNPACNGVMREEEGEHAIRER